MKIVVLSNGKIGKESIAEHKFKGKKIVERVVDFLWDIGKKDIYVVSDTDLKVKNTKHISLSNVDSLKNKQVIDLKFV